MVLNHDSDLHFTATGQPMPINKPSSWANACLWGEQAPNHPPFRFTDQSLIPVIVRIARSDKEIVASRQVPRIRFLVNTIKHPNTRDR